MAMSKPSMHAMPTLVCSQRQRWRVGDDKLEKAGYKGFQKWTEPFAMRASQCPHQCGHPSRNNTAGTFKNTDLKIADLSNLFYQIGHKQAGSLELPAASLLSGIGYHALSDGQVLVYRLHHSFFFPLIALIAHLACH
jgi:hypothetical protein